MKKFNLYALANLEPKSDKSELAESLGSEYAKAIGRSKYIAQYNVFKKSISFSPG